MTKSQKIAQYTNELNRCRQICDLPYSKFSQVCKIALDRFPFCNFQDVAEDINELFGLTGDDPNDDTPEVIASAVTDLWEDIY